MEISCRHRSILSSSDSLYLCSTKHSSISARVSSGTRRRSQLHHLFRHKKNSSRKYGTYYPPKADLPPAEKCRPKKANGPRCNLEPPHWGHASLPRRYDARRLDRKSTRLNSSHT